MELEQFQANQVLSEKLKSLDRLDDLKKKQRSSGLETRKDIYSKQNIL